MNNEIPSAFFVVRDDWNADIGSGLRYMMAANTRLPEDIACLLSKLNRLPIGRRKVP